MDYMLYARDLDGHDREVPDLCAAYVDVQGKDEETVRFDVHMSDKAIRLCRRLTVTPDDSTLTIALYDRFELLPGAAAPALGSLAVARLTPSMSGGVDVTFMDGDMPLIAGVRAVLRMFADFREEC